MSKSDTFENDLMKLEFNATPIANFADNAVGSPLTALFVGLHTADPGESGLQNASEVAASGYARVSTPRTSAGWTVVANSASPTVAIAFAEITPASNFEITHITVGVAVAGATKVHRRGILGTKAGLFTATVADVLTIPGNTLAVNDRVLGMDVDDQSLPTGMTNGTLYFVKTVSGNDITLSTTSGGATLDITAAGAGMLFKMSPITCNIGQAITPIIKTTTFFRDN